MSVQIKVLRKKNLKKALLLRRKLRVRAKIRGSVDCPRLNVFRSLKHIYVQAIDDDRGVTLASAATYDKDVRVRVAHMKKVEAAGIIGESIAKKLLEKGVTAVVFDRGGYRYAGRVAQVAQAARSVGLKF